MYSNVKYFLSQLYVGWTTYGCLKLEFELGIEIGLALGWDF